MNGNRAPTLLMLGMQTAFSTQVLSSLIEHGVRPRAVIIGQRKPRIASRVTTIPVAVDGSLERIALQAEIPLITANSLTEPDVFERVRDMQPDVLLVACFLQRLPPSWLSLAKLASVNLHPSLLPRYRGPCPLFWHFFYGERRTGITLHRLSDRLDAGDIVAQSPISLAADDTHTSVTALQARLGGALVGDMLRDLGAGQDLLTHPQSESHATYQPAPTESDLCLDTSMKVTQAYHFMRGVQGWYGPFIASVDSRVLILERALGFEVGATLTGGYELLGNKLQLQFEDGVLFAQGRVSSHEPRQG